METMKERFSKLLLGEDMSGSGKGVCTALAISNAITNLCGYYSPLFSKLLCGNCYIILNLIEIWVCVILYVQPLHLVNCGDWNPCLPIRNTCGKEK